MDGICLDENGAFNVLAAVFGGVKTEDTLNVSRNL